MAKCAGRCERLPYTQGLLGKNQEHGQIPHAVLLTPLQGGNRKGLWAGATSCIMQTLSHLHQWNWLKRGRKGAVYQPGLKTPDIIASRGMQLCTESVREYAGRAL